MLRYTLEDAMDKGKSRNLNLLRFFAAIMVIVSHAYPLSLGSKFGDPITQFTGGRVGLGGIAVGVFFLSSGLLVSKSIERKGSAMAYFTARAKRIFPPLIAMVFLTIFVLGIALTSEPIQQYIMNIDTYKYALNALLIPVHDLPGVFTNNIYGSVINGALWTLPVEVLCYIALYFVYRWKIMNKKNILYTIPLAIISFVLCYFSNIAVFESLSKFVLPIYIFYVGMIAYLYRHKIVLSNRLALISTVCFLVLLRTNLAEAAMVLLFPYIILVCIYNKRQCSKRLSKFGNYSYSIYLCGFPIQQTIVYFNGGSMSVAANALWSIVCALAIGYILYYIAEKPFA